MADRALLTIPETAASLQVSRATVYRLVKDGSLQVVKVRGLTRVRPSAIARYLDALERRNRETWVGLHG